MPLIRPSTDSARLRGPDSRFHRQAVPRKQGNQHFGAEEACSFYFDCGWMFVKVLLTLAALVAIMSASAAAQSPIPANAPSIAFGPKDMPALLQAVHCELTPHCKQVHVQFKAAAQMPPYDPVVHYAGLGGDPRVAVLWVNSDASSASMKDALFNGMLLACMDDGEAGPKWKTFYDLAAAADGRLPANTADPYLNRHKLVQIIDTIVHMH